MVGKLSGVSRSAATQSVTARQKKATKKSEKPSSSPLSLTDQILNKIDFSSVTSDADLRRKLIVETLVETFGHDLVASPKFVKLIDEINEGFANNPTLQTQLESVKKSKNLKF